MIHCQPPGCGHSNHLAQGMQGNWWKLHIALIPWTFRESFKYPPPPPSIHTVDGKNPAPPTNVKNPVKNGIDKLPTSTGAGFLSSTVVIFSTIRWRSTSIVVSWVPCLGWHPAGWKGSRTSADVLSSFRKTQWRKVEKKIENTQTWRHSKERKKWSNAENTWKY